MAKRNKPEDNGSAGKPALKSPLSADQSSEERELRFVASGWNGKSTKGQILIASFCLDVIENSDKHTEQAKRLALALQPLALNQERNTEDLLIEFARMIELPRKQGRQPRTFGQMTQEAMPVAEYLLQIEKLVACGESRANAESIARNEACALNGIGDRAMRKRIQEHGGIASQIVSLQLQAETKKPE